MLVEPLPLAEGLVTIDEEALEEWEALESYLSSRSLTHLDSAKDRHGDDVDEAEEDEQKAAAPPPYTQRAAAAAATAAGLAATAVRPRVTLQKGLMFSALKDPELEAEFQGQDAEAGRSAQLQWLAVRAWLWAACAARLLSAGLPRLAAGVAAACVAPAAAHALALVLAWSACKRHLLATALMQGLADVVGFVAMRPLYVAAAAAAGAGAGPLAAGSLQATLRQISHHLPCHAAAYLAFSSLRSGPPFIVRFATATALLMAQLFALGSLMGEAAQAGGGAAAPCAAARAPLCAALLAAAYCLPLAALYRREARRRMAFARARRPALAVDTSHVDPLVDPLSFTLPALAQVLALWSRLG